MTNGYAGYDDARARVAVGQRGARGWVRVSGADAVSFLHGILTNDIAGLQVGQWCYAAYLTPQGRMLSDMRVLRRGHDLAIETEPQVAEMIAGRFDASIFTEQVQISRGEPWTSDAGPTAASPLAQSILTIGPGARTTLAAVLGGYPAIRDVAVHEHREVHRDGNRLTLVGHEDFGVPAVDVLGSIADCAALARALEDAGAVQLGTLALEALRIEAGTPRFGTDMTAETIPLEAGIEARAISMTKGCYVGQEVIVRILHRGHGRVARRLVGLSVEATAAPAAGSPVAADGREVGLVTSSAFSPRLGHAIALGYVRRDVADGGIAVVILPDLTPATVTPLPFADR